MSAPDANSWQDISSAPKDGAAIIAWWPHLARPVVAWFYRGHWCFSRDKRQTFTIGSEPTVWMRLPKPPVQTTPPRNAS